MKWERAKQFVIHLVVSMINHRIGALAAVLAFYGFSSMIPLLLLLLYGASLLIPQASVVHFLATLLRSYVPTMPYDRTYLTGIVSRLASTNSHVGVVVLLGLLWTTIGGFVSLQQTLDVIWEASHRRSFVSQYVRSFAMMGILLLFTVLSSLASVVVSLLTHSMSGKIGAWSWLPLLEEIPNISFPLLLFITCYFCFRFLPSQSSPSRYLLFGSYFATCGIYLSRQLFIWYAEHLNQYESIYGALTFIMLFLFWIYIVSAIVLFGAELTVNLCAFWEHNDLMDDK